MAAAPLAKPYAFASPVTMEIDVVGVHQADVIEVIPASREPAAGKSGSSMTTIHRLPRVRRGLSHGAVAV